MKSRSRRDLSFSPDPCVLRGARDTWEDRPCSSTSRGKRDSEEVMNDEILSRGMRDSRRSRDNSVDRSRSPDRSRSGTPNSFISLRARSVEVEEVISDKNLEESTDILDLVNQEFEVQEYAPPINEKLANTINKRLEHCIDIQSEDHKERMASIKTPENINKDKLITPTINEELLTKQISLDRFAKRNDNRLSNIQRLAAQSNKLIIASTDSLYSNLSKIEAGEVKEELNKAVMAQTEAIGLLAQVKKEISQLRRSQLYSHLPKDIRGICYEKIGNDEVKLFGDNVKEMIKENKMAHYKSPSFNRNSFLGRRGRVYPSQQQGQRQSKSQYPNQNQRGKKTWSFSKRK